MHVQSKSPKTGKRVRPFVSERILHSTREQNISGRGEVGDHRHGDVTSFSLFSFPQSKSPARNGKSQEAQNHSCIAFRQSKSSSSNSHRTDTFEEQTPTQDDQYTEILLLRVMSDEFEGLIEDGSVAEDIVCILDETHIGKWDFFC